MDKKIAGLLGAAAALGTISSAQAATSPAPEDALRANSYAELLEPMPNAGAQLQAMDAQPVEFNGPGFSIQLGRHHHHHHHHHYRHHHHHHHNQYRQYRR